MERLHRLVFKRLSFSLLAAALSIFAVSLNSSQAQTTPTITFTKVDTLGNGQVYSAFWTADDSAIVVNSSRGVRVYSPEFELINHLKNIQQAVPSPTDDLLAGITRDGRVVLLTLDQPSQRIELPMNDMPYRLFFSRDGSRLAVVGNEQIWLWDIQSEALLNQFERELQMYSLDWSLNNKQIALGGVEGVRVCEVATVLCEKLPVESTGGHWGYLVSWGPEENQLAVARSNLSNVTNTLELWDIENQHLLSVIQAGDITAIHWDWSTNFITVGTRLSSFTPEIIIPPAITVWNASNGEMIIYSYLRDTARSLDWNHDHTQLMTVDAGNLVRVQEMSPEKANQFLGSIDEFMSTVNSLAWSPDGEMLVSGSEDGRARIWDVNLGEVIDGGATERGSIRSVVWNTHNPREDEIIFGGFDRSVYTKLLGSIGSREPFMQHENYNFGIEPGISAIDVNAEGLIASGGSDGDILILPISREQKANIIRTREAGIFDLEWMPDNKRIVAANGSVTFWDSTTLSLLETLTCPDIGIIGDVAVSSSGELLAAGGSYPICMWDLTTGERLETLLNYGSPMAWKPETTILAASDFNDPTLLRLWDVEREELVTTISVGTRITAIAWSPDGQSIAIGDTDGLIHIYEQES